MARRRKTLRELIDPEYLRWLQKYPRFPGVSECVRLILEGKARGSWAEIIHRELVEHAEECCDDLVTAFRADDVVATYVLHVLEDAKLPRSVPFLAEVLGHPDPTFAVIAERVLEQIDTRESRIVLFQWRSRHETE